MEVSTYISKFLLKSLEKKGLHDYISYKDISEFDDVSLGWLEIRTVESMSEKERSKQKAQNLLKGKNKLIK